MDFKLCMSASVATLLWAGAAQAQAAPAAAASGASSDAAVQEVVVTAEKREERLVNVPAAITAIQGSTLQRMGAQDLSDFAALVPGLQLAGQGGGGGQELVLRGLATGIEEDSALVGELVDGVPVGSSTAYAVSGGSTLDSGLWDINRVEVLRGPQGTLYGAAAMSGLISYVYNQPDLRRYGGALEAEGDATQGGAGSWALRGEINAPIIPDQLALRVSAFDQNDGGYIDDAALHENNINHRIEQGVRADLLWKPTDKFTANLEAIYQHDTRNASDEVSYDATTGRADPGPLSQTFDILDPGSFDYDEIALTLAYDLGPATVTSITSYESLTNQQYQDFDGSPDAPLFTNPFYLTLLGVPGPAATQMSFEDEAGTSKVNEELRVNSNGSGPFQYLAGFFTTHEGSYDNLVFDGIGANGLPQSNLDPGLISGLPSDYSEYAGFAQLSYTFFDRLTITGGLRYTYIDQTFATTLAGSEAPGLAAIHLLAATAPASATETDATYLVNARFALTADSNLYARAASGFRPGGPNVDVTGLPRTYRPDSLWDYEAGYKASFFGGRAQFDADVFYIDWTDIQLRAAVNGITGETNGGAASSRGVEAEGSFVPMHGLTVGGNVAYVDAHLDQPVPSVGGLAGDPLPLSATWSGAIFGNYVFPISGPWDGFVGGTVRADSSRNVAFPGGAAVGTPNFVLAPYATADIRGGIENDRYAVTLFIDNVGNSRAELSADTTNVPLANIAEVTIARPRTFGVKLDAKF